MVLSVVAAFREPNSTNEKVNLDFATTGSADFERAIELTGNVYLCIFIMLV